MDAFHLAILVCAVLLVVGTLVFWFGLAAPTGRQAGVRRPCAAGRRERR